MSRMVSEILPGHVKLVFSLLRLYIHENGSVEPSCRDADLQPPCCDRCEKQPSVLHDSYRGSEEEHDYRSNRQVTGVCPVYSVLLMFVKFIPFCWWNFEICRRTVNLKFCNTSMKSTFFRFFVGCNQFSPKRQNYWQNVNKCEHFYHYLNLKIESFFIIFPRKISQKKKKKNSC